MAETKTYDFKVNPLDNIPEGEFVSQKNRWGNPQDYHITRTDNGSGRVTWNIDVSLDTENLNDMPLDSSEYRKNLPEDFTTKAVEAMDIHGANKITQYDFTEYYNLKSLSIHAPTVTSLTPEYTSLNLLNCPSLEHLYIEASPEMFGNQSVLLPDSIKEVEIHNPDNDKTYTLPAVLFTNNHDGVSLHNRIRYAEQMLDNNIPITDYNVRHIMQAAHDGRNAVTNRLANYEAFGFLDVGGMVDSDKRSGVSEAFEKAFGRAPRISDSIAAMAQESNYNIPTETIIENFDLKRTASYLRNNIPAAVGSLLMSTLSKDDFDKAIKSPYYAEAAQLCGEYWKRGKDNRYLNLAMFIVNHPRANQNLIDNLIKYSSVIYLNKDASTKQAQAEISRASSFSEIVRIEQRYKDFRFSDCNFDLKFHDTEMGTLKATIMRPGDSRMANLGYDTHCCQHLGGAGETAMMYGLVADKAGFWAVEDIETHKIYAQAEIWEKDENTLVFDNIEFANDRDISGFLPIIGKWARESDYENIVMGNGYNNVKKNTLEQRAGIEPPMTDKVRQIIGENIYTDASHGISVIKDNGRVSEFFNENISLFEEKRDNTGNTHENDMPESERFLSRYSHLDVMQYARDLYREIDFDADIEDIKNQFEEAKTELTMRVIDDLPEEELIAKLVADSSAPQEFIGVINWAATHQLLDDIDKEDVAINAVYDAFSDRYNKRYIPEPLSMEIENIFVEGVDMSMSADEILDDAVERLSDRDVELDEDGSIEGTKDLRIDDLKRKSDFIIDNYSSPIDTAIEETAFEQSEMIYYNEMADYVRANYDLVRDEAYEQGMDVGDMMGMAYESAENDFRDDLINADELFRGAFGLMRAEDLFDTKHPLIFEDGFFGFEDLDTMRILESTRNSLICELESLKLFDIRVEDIPLSEAYEGFEPREQECVEVSADFYTINGVKLTTTCDYDFGRDIQPLRAQLAANFINMSPEKIAGELNIPESEKEKFIKDVQASLDTLEASYKYNIPKEMLDKYNKPEIPEEVSKVQELIDKKFLSEGKSIEDVRAYVERFIPKESFSINDVGEFAIISKDNVKELCDKILKGPAQGNASENPRLFVDMDGTLAIFNPVSTLEDLYEPGYFAELKPQWNVVEAVQNIIARNKDIDVYVLSAVLSDSPTAIAEKEAWLDEFLPEIDKEHRIFCPCGEDKGSYIPDGLKQTDFLLDDYTNNLDLWEPPARGIKLLNGINHTKGSWMREKLSFERNGADLADRITGIMTGGEHVQDTNLRLDPRAKMTGETLPVEIFDNENAVFTFINPVDGNKNYLEVNLTDTGWDFTFFDKDFIGQDAGTHTNVANMKDTVRDIMQSHGVALNDLSVFDKTVLDERIRQSHQKEEKEHKTTDYAKQQLFNDNNISRRD